jgi:hypothetical protein
MIDRDEERTRCNIYIKLLLKMLLMNLTLFVETNINYIFILWYYTIYALLWSFYFVMRNTNTLYVSPNYLYDGAIIEVYYIWLPYRKQNMIKYPHLKSLITMNYSTNIEHTRKEIGKHYLNSLHYKILYLSHINPDHSITI